MGAQFSPPTSHNFHWVFKAEWLRYQEKAENLIQCESIRNIWFERNEDQGLWYCYAKPQMGMVQMKSKHKSTKFSNKLIINSNTHWCFYLYQNSCHSVTNACFSKFHLHINDCAWLFTCDNTLPVRTILMGPNVMKNSQVYIQWPLSLIQVTSFLLCIF